MSTNTSPPPVSTPPTTEPSPTNGAASSVNGARLLASVNATNEPSLPDDAIIVSYSELDTFRQCPLKHYLAYELRFKREVDPTGPLAKGTLWHQVMEIHYRAIMEHQRLRGGPIDQIDEALILDEVKDNIQALLFDPKTGKPLSDVCDLIWWMYEGYVKKYGADLGWRILAVEHNIVTPLRDATGERTNYYLKAKIDLIVYDYTTHNLWVVDHKSGQNLPNDMDLEIDDQFGLYAWAMREMGKPVMGSIHSAVRTTRNTGDYPNSGPKYTPQTLDQRMRRTYLNRSPVELTNLAYDAYMAAYAAHPPVGGVPARYSAPDPRSCGWKCDFKEVHIATRKGRPLEEALYNFGFVVDRTRH